LLFEQILFFVAAAGAVGGALGVVMLHNPFYSVLSLIAHLVSLAILFLLLRSEFLAAAQIVVYAGAIMVLYLFVTAYVGGADQTLRRTGEAGAVGQLGIAMAGALFVVISIAVIGSSLDALDTRGPDLAAGFGSPGEIGQLLLRKFLIPFEAASFLLLVAAVCAVVLARRRRGLEDEPDVMGGESTEVTA
jgi:NADH:ubiquinone oxidoreductase subunit 6 (subunit J)